MRVFYTLYKGTEIADIIKENEKNINFITFGNDIETVNPLLFDFMKEKVNIKKVKDNVIFLAMIFNKITKEKITRMAITYGLWEGQKGDIRNEMKYTFEVEPVNNGYIHSIYNQTEKNIKK